MDLSPIRETIRLALQEEHRSGLLANLLSTRLASLHPAIQLPDGNTPHTLLHFISAYIEQVPELLEAAATVAQETGLEAHIEPLLRVAVQFFQAPVHAEAGLAALLDDAYLAQRLIEEVNDRYLAQLGRPLIPLDNTTANLIAHQLIGEPFANALDQAVFDSVDGLLDPSRLSAAEQIACRAHLEGEQLQEAWQNWPCLSRQLGVGLQLGGGATAG
jgi:hypothetical protein